MSDLVPGIAAPLPAPPVAGSPTEQAIERRRAGPLGGRTTVRLPFWLLQVAELAVTAALVDFSLHVHHGQVLVVGATAWAVLAVTARGPLGIVRICSRRLHRVLVIAVGVLLALTPIPPMTRPDIQGIIIVVLVGVGMARLATLTTVEERVPPGTAGPAPGAQEAAPTRPIAAGATSAAVAGAGARLTARHAGRIAGRLQSAPRRAGRMAGQLRSAPRHAGRIAGRARSARR